MLRYKRLLRNGGLVVLASCWVVLASPAQAREALVPVASATIAPDRVRITFEWPETVFFKTRSQGNTLFITFDRAVRPNFATLLPKVKPFVQSATLHRDGKTIALVFDEPYKIRTFISDNVSAVELVGLANKNRKAKQQLVDAAKLGALSPAAGAAEDAKPDAAAAATLTATPSQPAAQEAPPAASAPEAKKPAATAAGTDAQATGVEPSEISADGKIKVSVSAAEDNAVLRFPFQERMAMAAFIRANVLWIAFHKPLALNLSDFKDLPRTVVGKAELMSSDKTTIIRMPVDDNIFASVVKEEGGFNLGILLTSKSRPLQTPLKMTINTEPPTPANITIAALETAEPITVSDPVVGDKLAIVPLYNIAEGIPANRDFIEFTLLPTAQGIAVVKKSDEVNLATLRNGIRLSSPKGVIVTADLPEPTISQADNAASTATFFPDELWKPSGPNTLFLQTAVLFKRIVESKDPQEANELRLRMAQLYLSRGMAAEALGHLDNINRLNPAYYRSAKLSAVHGLANFMMYRFTMAAKDFAAAELNNNKEIEYWRNMLADLLGDTDSKAYDYLAMNDDYISKYPAMVRERLAVVAADRSIAAKDYNTALKIFDTLNKDNMLEGVSHYINFLLAKISAETGQETEAFAKWDELAADYRHQFVRANAEYARIAWGLDHGSLSREEAADRLERLRLNWHGDALELKVLSLLGTLYEEKKDYVNAMRVWHMGVTGFQNTASAIDMSRKMQEAFIIMFNEGAADNMPPLDALALYYEYRNYTPPGKTGDQMIERLADRLVAVDLLDQATALLDRQMHFQTEKEQRSHLGAKLASIYLMNNQPQKALLALQDSMYGENSLMLRLHRNRLAAQSMSDLGQTDKAMQTLGQDDSPEAERIRLDVYWRQKNWEKVIQIVEQMLKQRKDITAPVTMDEAEVLLRLALAYVFQNNTVQLQYLQDYFGPLMAKNPYKQIFDFVTSPDITVTTTNFDEVVTSMMQTRQFLNQYSARVKMVKAAPEATK
ncbi:MAG: hypothetical protein SFT92_01625 [Rickettsiales bacterium]|nr:hypothetical protein [Rickettsiales bacterium]